MGMRRHPRGDSAFVGVTPTQAGVAYQPAAILNRWIEVRRLDYLHYAGTLITVWGQRTCLPTPDRGTVVLGPWIGARDTEQLSRTVVSYCLPWYKENLITGGQCVSFTPLNRE